MIESEAQEGPLNVTTATQQPAFQHPRIVEEHDEATLIQKKYALRREPGGAAVDDVVRGSLHDREDLGSPGEAHTSVAEGRTLHL